MEGKNPNKQEVIEQFIEAYNKSIDWNCDLLKIMNPNVINSAQYIANELEQYLSTEKITKDNYDLENAVISKYDDGKLEMGVFSYKSYGTIYFWVTPWLNEQQYKNERVEIISRLLMTRKTELEHTIQYSAKEISTINQIFETLNENVK
jgi:hypothetical protein